MKENQFKAEEHLRESHNGFVIMVFADNKTEPFFVSKNIHDQFKAEFGGDVKSKTFIETWIKTLKV